MTKHAETYEEHTRKRDRASARKSMKNKLKKIIKCLVCSFSFISIGLLCRAYSGIDMRYIGIVTFENPLLGWLGGFFFAIGWLSPLFFYGLEKKQQPLGFLYDIEGH